MVDLPACRPILATAAGIQRVAQAISQEVERENDGRDGEAWVESEHRCGEDIDLRTLQHVPPRREWRLHAEAEVTERRFRQDRGRDAKRGRDDERGNRLREDVADEQSRRRNAK